MPGLPSAHQGLQAGINHQVVHANTTLNAFVGGKQKAWMLNAAPVQPSPRPLRPQQVQQVQQVQQPTPQLPMTPANLLPSPAPSDEPSPAVSNPRDSPNPRTLPITTAAQRQNTGLVRPAAASADLPLHPGDTARDNADVVAGGPARPPTTDNTMTEAPLQSVQSPLAMAPPSFPHAHAYQTGQVTTEPGGSGPVLIDLESPTLQSPPAPDGGEQPNKRRRIETSSISSPGVVATPLSDLVARIDLRISQQGGIDTFKPDVERPRFQILRDACDKKDTFYITMHQLYCLWSIDQQSASRLLLCDFESVQIGFEILGTVLKANTGFSRSNLEWCARFPGRSLDPQRNPIVNQIAAFLASLSRHWTSLHDYLFNRHYPYLMDELIGKLQCYSPVLQKLLFTAARRRMGVLDGALGAEIDGYFMMDQQAHFINGQYLAFASPNDAGLLERQNWKLINIYRQILTKARAAQEQWQQDQERQRQQQQQQELEQRQQILIQQRAQQMEPHLPRQTFVQQPISAQAAPRTNDQYEQNRFPVGVHARRASRHTSQPRNPPIRVSTMSPQAAAAVHHAMGSPSFQGSAFSPAESNFQVNAIPPNLVLPSSSTIAHVPPQPMVSPMVSPQAYVQALPRPQQYNYASHQSTSPNIQNSQFGNRYVPQMASVHPHWAGAMNPSPMSPGQSLPSMEYMSSMRYNAAHPDNTAMIPQTPTLQRMNQNGSPMAGWPRLPSTLPQTVVPRPGQMIERSDHPHSHHERKSLIMSLHQAHARSPDRTRRIEDEEERYYQSVRSFALEPFLLEYYHPALEVTITPEDFSLLCKEKHLPALDGQRAMLAIREYTNGSLRYRLRCCQFNSDKPIAESEWVMKDTSWPDHIFPHFNQEKLVVRRSTHHGKDLPVELTDFMVPGVNKLKVALTRAASTRDKKPKRFYMAVEVLETLSHSQVLKQVWSNGLSDREDTLGKIRKRVNAVPDEDGIAVIDRTGTTTSDLSIDLTDPFSASIFAVPARGATCTHLECFDLETWLNTRPTKQAIKCGHQKLCTCPKYVEPSDADKWKCPICFADARPRSLRIDSFLLEVRRQLEEQGKLDTKSILVAADGTWRPVIEPDDDDDAGSDGDGPNVRGPVNVLRKQPSKSASVERAVEVIQID